MEQTRQQHECQRRIRGIDQDVGEVESSRVIAPQRAVQGKGRDGERALEQHPFFIRRVGPVIRNEYPRQVRQPDQGVVLDDRDVIKVEVVADGIGIDENCEHEHRNHKRKMLSHLLCIEYNPGWAVDSTK